MTNDLGVLINHVETTNKPHTNLPNGTIVYISHIGYVKLENDIRLKGVLCVPEFRHDLLSVNKSIQQGSLKAIYYVDHCTIQDCATQTVKGIGRAQDGCTT